MKITVAKIELKEKRSAVITTEGRRLGVWTDKLGKFGLTEGGTYEVETEESNFNGRTLTNITQAKQIGSMPTLQNPTNTGISASTPFRTPEQMFVQDIVTAYINNGRCEPEKLTETINYIRKAWKNTFGFDDKVFTPSEAGRHAA